MIQNVAERLKNTRAIYLHKHYTMTMNNILTSGGLKIMSFNDSHF